MKKYLTAIVCSIMICIAGLGFAGCGGKKPEEKDIYADLYGEYIVVSENYNGVDNVPNYFLYKATFTQDLKLIYEIVFNTSVPDQRTEIQLVETSDYNFTGQSGPNSASVEIKDDKITLNVLSSPSAGQVFYKVQKHLKLSTMGSEIGDVKDYKAADGEQDYYFLSHNKLFMNNDFGEGNISNKYVDYTLTNNIYKYNIGENGSASIEMKPYLEEGAIEGQYYYETPQEGGRLVYIYDTIK